jgi:hypothetical protein
MTWSHRPWTRRSPNALVKNENLFKSFINSELLADSAVAQALEAHSAHEVSGSGRHALVVDFEFDKGRIVLFVFFIALLGLGIGVLVAVLQENWDLGAFIGGSVFAFVAILQGALVSMYT